MYSAVGGRAELASPFHSRDRGKGGKLLGKHGPKQKMDLDPPLNLKSHCAKTRDNLPREGQLPLPAIKHLELVVCKALAQKQPWKMLCSGGGSSVAHGMQLGYGSPRTHSGHQRPDPANSHSSQAQFHFWLFSAFLGFFSTSIATQLIRPLLLLCRAPNAEPL